jgi:hypothetical protein
MAAKAINCQMSPSEREVCHIVIKSPFRFTGRMACKASITIVVVSCYTGMFIGSFTFHMARYTGDNTEVTGIGMAFRALIPLAIMGPTIDRKILTVMIKC